MARHSRKPRQRGQQLWLTRWWRSLSRRRRITITIAAAVTTGLAAAAAVPGGPGRLIDTLTGGGPLPTSILTKGAHTYTAINLTPPASQRRHLTSFHSKLPALGLDGDNPAGSLLRLLLQHTVADGAQWPDELDTTWVGPRMITAAYPPDPATPDGPRQVVAVQTSNPQAADHALTRLRETVPGRRLAWHTHNGYVIIAASDQAVASVTAGNTGASLADDPTIRADLAKVDSRPVLSAWADLEAVNRDYPGGLALWRTIPWLTDAFFGPVGIHGVGRVAVSGIAERDGLTIRVWSSALTTAAAHSPDKASGSQPALIRYAPKDATLALGVRGGAAILLDQWPALMAANPLGLPAQIAATGINTPGDLAAAVGNESMYATVPAPDGITDWVARSRTPQFREGFQAAQVLAETVLATLTPMRTPSVRLADGGVVIATSVDLAQTVTTPTPQLGQTPEFQVVLPDVDRAQAAVYRSILRAGHRLVVGGELHSDGQAIIRLHFPKEGGAEDPQTGEEPDWQASSDGDQQLPVGPTPITRASLPEFRPDPDHIRAALKQANELVADRDRLTESWPQPYRDPLHEHAIGLQNLLAGESAKRLTSTTSHADLATQQTFYRDLMAAVTRYADQVAVIGWWYTHSRQWSSTRYWDQVDTVIAEQRLQGRDASDLESAAAALRTLGPKVAGDIAPYLEALAAVDPRHTQQVITAGQALANAPIANLEDVLSAAAVLDTLFTNR